MFNIKDYIHALASQNKLCRTLNFMPSTCSGINYIEGMLQKFRSISNFISVSDITDGSTVSRSGGWFSRRVFTVFILMRYKAGDRNDQEEKLDTCREIYRQFLSRMIVDSNALDNSMVYLNVADIRKRELGGYFLSGCTGLYFMLSLDEPTNLQYNEEEWDTTRM